MSISECLKKLRMELGYSQSELAQALNLSYATINRWENQRSVPSKAVKDSVLMKIYEMNISDSLKDYIEETFNEPADKTVDKMRSMDISMADQIINESATGVFVCERDSYEVIYMNDTAASFVGRDIKPHETCYSYFEGRKTPCENCFINKEDFEKQIAERKTSLSGEKKYIAKGEAIKWEGKPAYIEYIDRESLITGNESAIAIALSAAGIQSWIYNVKTGECIVSDSLQEEFNIPERICNYPESVFNGKIVLPEYENLYREKIKEIKEGKDSVSFDVQGYMKDNKIHWIRFQISAIDKINGVTHRAIGTGTVIDTEKFMEARVEMERARTKRDEDYLTGYVVSSLNYGKIIEHSQYAPNAPLIDKTYSLDANIREAAKSVVYDTDREEFMKVHNIEYLLNEFKNGKTAVSIEFRREQPDGMIRWVRNILHLVEDPATLQIMLYEYCYDINETKSVEVVMNAAIVLTYDCLASIDLVHNQTTFLTQDNLRIGKNVVIDIYGDVVKNYGDKFVIEEDRALFFEHSDIRKIQERLEAKPVFEHTYRIVNSKGELRIMRNKYSYYDFPKKRCLMMRTDVTDIVKLEEEQKLKNEQMKLLNAIPGGVITFDTVFDDRMHCPILYCSDGVLKLAGYTDKKEFINTYTYNPEKIIFKSDMENVISDFKELINTHKPKETTYRLIRKDGSLIWVRHSSKIITDVNNHEIIVSVYQNISDDTYLYHDIINASDTIIQVVDKETHEVYFANKAAIDFAGQDSDNYAGRKCYEYFGHTDKPCSYCNFKNGELLCEETQVEKSGKTYSVKGYFMNWHGREVYTEYVVDITKHKKLEHSYEQYISAVMRTVSDAVSMCRINVSQNTCYVAKSWLDGEDNVGDEVRLDHYLNETYKRIIDPEERTAYLKTFSGDNLINAYKEGRSNVSLQFHIEYDDKTIVIMRSTIRLIMNPESGDLEGIFFMSDVTQKAINEIIFDQIITKQYDGIELIDPRKGTCSIRQFTFNDSDSNVQNETYKDSCNNAANYFIHPEDKEMFLYNSSIDNIQNKLSSQLIYSYTVRNVIQGEVLVKKCSYCYLGHGKSTILGTIEDITTLTEEERLQKEELETALREAQAAGHAKSEFLSRMSHDMRTPMNAIIGLSALTLDEATNPEVVRSNMSQMRSTSDYMLGLINDILDMAKIEEGSLTLNLAPIRYSEFVLDLKTMFQAQCDVKDIELYVQESDKDPVVLADRVRLEQIFFNIISNSVKYTPQGGKISFYLNNYNFKDGRLHCDYIMEDDGIGMSEEFMKHLFEPFTQENTAVTPELQGSGLGLSITKQLVELMGGTIAIESEKGKGTTVRIHLSYEFVGDTSLEVRTKHHITDEDADDKLFGKNVLLVEDHPLNTQIAKKLLAKKHISVIHAENGRIAVEKFSAAPVNAFDAILMDIRMPEMNGLDATRNIRKLDRPDAKTIPIIAMSANAYAEDVEKSLDAGMNAHLAKPVDPETMYDTLLNSINFDNIEKPELSEKKSTKQGTVLIVDDAEINANLIATALEDVYDTLIASNGEEALRLLEYGEKIIAVITDLQMPVMDGVELVKHIRANDKYNNIAIIANTLHESIVEEEEMLKYGADDFIFKVTNPLILRKRMENVLRKYSN